MRAAAALASLALAACVGAPPVPELLAPRDPAIAALQVRHYDGAGAAQIAQATVIVLQDLGFHITASDATLGLIVATRGQQKTAGEIAAQFGNDMLQIFKNMVTFQWHREPNPEKSFGKAGHSAAVLITPAASGSAVRLALHRYVNRPTGEAVLVWAEEVAAPESYQTFFSLLGKALNQK